MLNQSIPQIDESSQTGDVVMFNDIGPLRVVERIEDASDVRFRLAYDFAGGSSIRFKMLEPA